MNWEAVSAIGLVLGSAIVSITPASLRLYANVRGR